MQWLKEWSTRRRTGKKHSAPASQDSPQPEPDVPPARLLQPDDGVHRYIDAGRSAQRPGSQESTGVTASSPDTGDSSLGPGAVDMEKDEPDSAENEESYDMGTDFIRSLDVSDGLCRLEPAFVDEVSELPLQQLGRCTVSRRRGARRAGRAIVSDVCLPPGATKLMKETCMKYASPGSHLI